MKRKGIFLSTLLLVLCVSAAAHAFTEYDHSEFDHPVGVWETDGYGQLDYDADANPAETPSVYNTDDSYPAAENYDRGAEYDYDGHQGMGIDKSTSW
jgi:hypothetical protein